MRRVEKVKDKIKVLVVDDSSTARDAIQAILSSDEDIKVLATAADGVEAIDLVPKLRPDLITLDINMPRMNGIEAIQHIMAYNPTPILVVTSNQDAGIAFESLSKGALEVVGRPSLSDDGECEEFIEKVKLLAKIKVITHVSGKRKKSEGERGEIVAIGSSTGGPQALSKILSSFPSNLSAAVLIVQHISEGFTDGLVKWLKNLSGIEVKEACKDDIISPGLAYVAPTGHHMEVANGGKISLTDGPLIEGQRPSADVLLSSVGKKYGSRCIGVILTGMGSDGARGIKAIKDCGGATIAQDEESSVVFGMPKAAIELGAVDKVLSLDSIAGEVLGLLGSD